MSIESETWRDASSSEENSGAGHDSSQFNKEGGYNRPSYNRGNEDHSYRPRFDNENGDRPQRAYSNDRSYHPRFNLNGENGNRPQRSYGNNAGDNRPYRPRYNGGGGDRPQCSYGNSADGDRPYRPRYNSEGDSRPQRSYGNNAGGDRPYRPRYNNEGGDHPQRSCGSNAGDDRPCRPRCNSEGGDRPQRSCDNNASGDRSYRLRYSGRGGDRPQCPYGNRGSYNHPIRHTADYDPNAKYSKKKQTGYEEQFVDPNESIRLNKFLTNAGVCSCREADEFITADVVSVNGEVVTELDTKAKHSDKVEFHDQAVNIERRICVLLNKPKDTATTSGDPQAHRTVMDLVGGACSERIYPAGRLNRNATDVLLLANNDDLASRLTHPKYLKKKIYHVYLDKNLTRADMEQVAADIQLDDGEIQADAISYTDDFKRDEVGVEIHSGRDHIVRRIFESLGYKVVKLGRVFLADLTKGGLRRGEWHYLTEQEVSFLHTGSFE